MFLRYENKRHINNKGSLETALRNTQNVKRTRERNLLEKGITFIDKISEISIEQWPQTGILSTISSLQMFLFDLQCSNIFNINR